MEHQGFGKLSMRHRAVFQCCSYPCEWTSNNYFHVSLGLYIKLWWHTKTSDDVATGIRRTNTWEILKKELKDQFLPINTTWMARESLKKLKKTNSIKNYVKELCHNFYFFIFYFYFYFLQFGLIRSVSNVNKELKYFLPFIC